MAIVNDFFQKMGQAIDIVDVLKASLFEFKTSLF